MPELAPNAPAARRQAEIQPASKVSAERLNLEGLSPENQRMLKAALDAGFEIKKVNEPAPGYTVTWDGKRRGFIKSPTDGTRLEDVAAPVLRELNLIRLTEKHQKDLTHITDSPGTPDFVSDAKADQLKKEFSQALGLAADQKIRLGAKSGPGFISVVVTDANSKEPIAQYSHGLGGTQLINFVGARAPEQKEARVDAVGKLVRELWKELSFWNEGSSVLGTTPPSAEKKKEILAKFDELLGLKPGTLTDIHVPDGVVRGTSHAYFLSGAKVAAEYFSDQWATPPATLTSDVKASKVPYKILRQNAADAFQAANPGGKPQDFEIERLKDGSDSVARVKLRGKVIGEIRYLNDSQDNPLIKPAD